jgi:hypothetical protein
MENHSTFLDATKLKIIVQAAADEIRSFLGFVQHPHDGSAFDSQDPDGSLWAGLSGDMRRFAAKFARDPGAFSTSAMLRMGEGLEAAIKNFVRIEVRRTKGVAGAAQVVAKGIEGDFRIAAMRSIRRRPGLGESQVAIKFAGRTSIEFNVRCVNKALPFRFLRHHWAQTLSMMAYTPGSHLDARMSHTLVAADGDGTIYGGPTLTKLPTLKSSPARKALNEYLKLGGVFVLVSGNDLERSAMRLKHGLEATSLHRCILVGNGAASMYVYGYGGRLREVADYRRHALRYVKTAGKGESLDAIFIGDDGHTYGNDMDAFQEVGLQRSFVVGHDKKFLDARLRGRFVAGGLSAAKRLFEEVNAAVRSCKRRRVFTPKALKKILAKARK